MTKEEKELELTIKIKAGDRVTFDPIKTPKGISASNVELINE